MTYANNIIQKFGGISSMAKALEVPFTTVSNWKRFGEIPSKRQRFILRKARELGIQLEPQDFFLEGK